MLPEGFKYISNGKDPRMDPLAQFKKHKRALEFAIDQNLENVVIILLR